MRLCAHVYLCVLIHLRLFVPQTELVSEGVLASNSSCPDLPKWPALEYLASAFPRVLVQFLLKINEETIISNENQ